MSQVVVDSMVILPQSPQSEDFRSILPLFVSLVGWFSVFEDGFLCPGT